MFWSRRVSLLNRANENSARGGRFLFRFDFMQHYTWCVVWLINQSYENSEKWCWWVAQPRHAHAFLVYVYTCSCCRLQGDCYAGFTTDLCSGRPGQAGWSITSKSRQSLWYPWSRGLRGPPAVLGHKSQWSGHFFCAIIQMNVFFTVAQWNIRDIKKGEFKMIMFWILFFVVFNAPFQSLFWKISQLIIALSKI